MQTSVQEKNYHFNALFYIKLIICQSIFSRRGLNGFFKYLFFTLLSDQIKLTEELIFRAPVLYVAKI